MAIRGTWEPNDADAAAVVDAQGARFIRLDVIAAVNGNASAAEIKLVGTPSS